MQYSRIQVLVIYSTLSFCLYSMVCSGEELQYCFRYPAALPLPAYLGIWWGILPSPEGVYPVSQKHLP
jgi:hypothetical protein